MIRYYFCTNGNDVQGPLDEPILIKMYNDGTIPNNTPVCREGLQEWKPINEVFATKVSRPKVADVHFMSKAAIEATKYIEKVSTEDDRFN